MNYEAEYTVRVPNPKYAQYSKMGGFLLVITVFSCLGLFLTIVGFLVSLPIQIMLIFNAQSITTETLVQIIYADCSSVFWIVLDSLFVFMLFNRNRHFLKVFCLRLFLHFMSLIAPIFMGTFSFERLLANLAPWIYIYILIGCLFYFVKSVRVRTYMGSDEYMTQFALTARMKPPLPVPEYLIEYGAVHTSPDASGYPTNNSWPDS